MLYSFLPPYNVPSFNTFLLQWFRVYTFREPVIPYKPAINTARVGLPYEICFK